MTYYLRTWGDPALRRRCRPVSEFSDLDGLISSMQYIIDNKPGLGIAAPQVGDDRQILIARIDGEAKLFVNPQIKKARCYIATLEGCLSLPKLTLPKIRRFRIDLEYQTKSGNKKSETFSGLNAIVLQH